MLGKDADYFQEVQTQTGWGRTLKSFADWCAPKPGWLTLDVGCGPGLLPSIFDNLGCRAVGIDLEMDMFQPSPLHPDVLVADVYHLPFKPHTFDLITATNLIFLLAEPVPAMRRIKHCLSKGGKLAMLNPSEALNQQSALRFVDEKGLDGVGRDTFLQWARRAEENHHWTAAETSALYRDAGMECAESAVKIGPGFARFSWGQ